MHIKWPKVKTFIEIFKESDLDLDEILNNKNMGICRKIMLTEDIKNMETITKENAKSKSDIAFLLYANKSSEFRDFIELAELLLDRYAELKQNKNMEKKEKTPYDVMMENNRDVQAYCNLIGYMNEHNLIIDIEDQCKEKSTLKDLIFKEKENMRTEIKPNGEVHLHIHSLLKEVKEVHIPPVDQEIHIKSQVIDIITKALQEAKIKTDGTK